MIEDFGWSDELQTAFAPHAARGLLPGRVTVQQRDLYTLAGPDGELRARLTGRLAFTAAAGELPVVGDFVAFTPPQGQGEGAVHALLPRRTVFTRRAAFSEHETQVVAANVDTALITEPINAPPNVRRLERYLAAARQSGAQAVVVLTKADLCADLPEALELARAVALGAPVIAVSVRTGAGMADFAAQLSPGRTAVLLGASGAGKSSLVNALAGQAVMATGEVRENDARGRHTTTHRELIRLPSGALILDTPGMRELGLMDAEAGLAATFEDVEALVAACRFSDCAHGAEPGCAVRAAIAGGALNEDRWRSYSKLQKELAHLDRRIDPVAREAERKRWRAVQKTNRARTAWRERRE